MVHGMTRNTEAGRGYWRKRDSSVKGASENVTGVGMNTLSSRIGIFQQIPVYYLPLNCELEMVVSVLCTVLVS
jgi:hypothetical protein